MWPYIMAGLAAGSSYLQAQNSNQAASDQFQSLLNHAQQTAQARQEQLKQVLNFNVAKNASMGVNPDEGSPEDVTNNKFHQNNETIANELSDLHQASQKMQHTADKNFNLLALGSLAGAGYLANSTGQSPTNGSATGQTFSPTPVGDNPYQYA